MDVQLKELIEKIKSEGVKSAEEQAASIIGEAEKKAENILSKAKTEAEQLHDQAEKDARQREQSGKEALAQAGRDLILNIQKKIENLFNGLLETETASAYNPSVLEETIVTLVKSWDKEHVADIQVLLSRKDLDKLETPLRSKLAAEIKKGFEVKSSPHVEAGFRVSEKNGGAYYNFSAQGIAELLSDFLNPKLSEIIKKSAELE